MAGSRTQPILFVLVAFLGFASAFSFESLIEPLMIYSNTLEGDGGELALEKLSELGRLVDDTARNFFNITIGTSTSLTYGNALFVIFAVSIAVLGGMILLFMASNSVLTGNSIDHGDYSPEEAAANAARLFLSYINSTSTITASYALVIILGTSLVMLALTGLAYLVASAVFTGTSINSYYGKRSIPDDENEDLHLNLGWTRILEILDLMEEQFQRTGAAQKNKDHEDECKKLTLCRLFADHTKEDLSEPQSKLIKLSVKLSELVEKYGLDSSSGYSPSVHSKITDYLAAKKLGSDKGASCESTYSKCTN